jgi:DNA helicase-2/ATP-dependent DNA helicase PcrA
MTKRIDKPDTDADKSVKTCIGGTKRKCFVVTAGAGSGKTTSLVKALDYIAKTHGNELRRRQQQVACITYTEIAVKEIWDDVGNNELFHVSTIHSFLWSIVKPFQNDIRKWLKVRLQEKLSKARQKLQELSTRAVKGREKLLKDIVKLEQAIPKVDGIHRFTYETAKDYGKGVLGHNDVIDMVPELILRNPLLVSIVSQRYPFVFVDESQDTFRQVVDALVCLAKGAPEKFCLGFFGDPMQQIYGHGAGAIALEAGWERIEKPENFRSPQQVLNIINKIRAEGDGIVQTRGRHTSVDGSLVPLTGAAHLFILPNDNDKSRNLAKVRSWLAQKYADENWLSDNRESDVRILVIVHRMAAVRLGFQSLFESFNDDTPDKFKDSFLEGTSWMLRPFLRVLLPLAEALKEDRQFDVMNILRRECPQLRAGSISGETLVTLKADSAKLANLLAADGSASVFDVLSFATKANLLMIDERFDEFIGVTRASEIVDETTDEDDEETIPGEEDDSAATREVLRAFLRCSANQLWPYAEYLNDQSPYSTQHGIKGAEFERVLVIIDDEENTHTQYSYDKLLGLEALSKTDNDNIASDKESVLDRTRRLFYVCCSRATKDLGIVLYANNVQGARLGLSKSILFSESNIHVLSELNASEVTTPPEAVSRHSPP